MGDEIFVEGEDNFVETWRDGLDESMRGEKCLEGIKSFPDLVKSVVNAQHTIGKKGVIIPGEDATPEETNAYHVAIGRPEKASDYKFDKAELPKGMVADEKMEGVFRDIAHTHGLNQAQASAIVGGINNYMIEGFNANNKAIEDNQAASVALLKKVWGKDTDANFALAERAFKTYVPDPVKQEAFGELGDSPALLEAFLAIGKAMSEDNLKGGGGLGAGVDATKKLAEIMNKKDHPYFNAKAPGHKEAVAEVQALNDIIHPEPAKE